MTHGFTWIEIDLKKLIENYKTALTLVQEPTVVSCVLKANAYGHGMVEVAQALEKAGCASFAVSAAGEALALREAGVKGDILVMGKSEDALLDELADRDVVFALSSLEQAKKIKKPSRVHLKAETGFNRLGFQKIEDMQAVMELANVQVEGLFSHLSLIDAAHDHAQHDKLMAINTALGGIRDVHICDSIGMVRYSGFHHTRVRIGAFLYGVRPFRSEDMPFECYETLAFYSTVTGVHLAKKGEYVGYDDSEPLSRDTWVATIQAGYGDGYPRRMAKKANVCIRGQMAPVLSLVCMDQMMADITDLQGVRVGDRVTLLGNEISYLTYANWANSNRNEAIATLSQRPKRIYLEAE